MLTDLFQNLNTALEGAPAIALAAAFAWGVCSVLLSPCHLAGIPLLIAYVNDQEVETARHAAGLSTLFALGILVTMTVIGFMTTIAGRMVGDTGPFGGYMMCAVFTLIGLHMMDVVSVPWFKSRKEKVRTKGALGALLLGLLFGIASGPCTFAFLAPVLAVVFRSAGTNLFFGSLSLALYAMGHCCVLVVAGTSVEQAKRFADWNRETKTAQRAKFTIGVLLILAGLYFLYKTV